MSAPTLVLLVALACCLVTLGVVSARLSRARDEVRVLRERVEELERPEPGSRTRRAAGLALRTAVGTAVRVREQGVGGFLTSSIEELTGIALADRSEIARVAGPDGTVTVLFSDIEDSTALNEQLGDRAWVQVLEAHDRLVRERVARHGGHVVKSQGDGYMVVFGDVEAALRAATGIQRRLAAAPGRRLRRTPVSVRMGLHTGPTIERDGDFFGRNVAYAARVAAVAAGGQVLVSAEVQKLLAEQEHPFTLVEMPSATFKGFPGTHRVWAVTRP